MQREHLCPLRSNLSWLGYGCLKQDWTLIAVNAIGAALQTLYILAYLYYTPVKLPVLLRSLLLLAVLAAGYGYFTLLIGDTRTRLARLGLFCSVFTISMYLSPLADLAKIVRSKSTRCLSFPLTVTTFLASTSWTLYGLQLHDPYIMVASSPSACTSRHWLIWCVGLGEGLRQHRGCPALDQPDICFCRPRLSGASRHAACPSP
uniref:Sugar transporter SWEET1 n=1 Tax=Bubo bubo TaxID=30461 RepID=A0A8C0G089_BUBBB